MGSSPSLWVTMSLLRPHLIVGYPGMGCPKKDQEDSSKAAQVPAEQPSEAKRATKSLPCNLARQSGRPSPYRATKRGEARDQVPTEKPCDPERSTKSLSSNLARQSEHPSPCLATSRGGADDQVLAEQPCQGVSNRVLR
jgi:hypothetical protein